MDTIVSVVKALLDGATVNKMDPLTVPYPFNDEVGKWSFNVMDKCFVMLTFRK